MFLSIALSLIISCGGDGAQNTDADKQNVEQQMPPVKIAMMKASGNLLAGKADVAFKELAAELPKHLKNGSYWRLMTYVGQQVEDSAALLAALSTLDDGGEKERSSTLKFFLYSHHGDSAKAAEVANSAEPERKLAMLSMLKMQTYQIPAEEGDTPAHALFKAIGADPSDASGLLETAKAVAAWEAKYALGQAALVYDNKALALETFEALSAEKNPMASTLGHVNAAALQEDPAKRLAHLESGMKTAVKEFDLVNIANLLKAARTDDEWTKLGTIYKLEDLLNEKTKGTLLGHTVGKAAYDSGKYGLAHKLSKRVRESMGDEKVKAASGNMEAMSAFYLRDSAAITAAAEHVSADLKASFLDFASFAKGQPLQGSGQAVRAFKGSEFVNILLSIAENDSAAFSSLVDEGVAAADELGDDAAIAMQLAKETHLREVNGEDTSTLLDEINAKFGEKYPNLLPELAVRRFLTSGSGSISTTDDAPDLIQAWADYTSGAEPTKSKGLAIPIAALSLLKKAFETGKGYKGAVNALWQRLPVHRVGVLSTGTALDGSHGLRGKDIIDDMVGQTDEKLVAATLIIRSLEDRRDLLSADAANGFNHVIGMEDQNREKLIEATARAKAGMVNYWTGGSFPESQFSELAKLEQGFLSGKAKKSDEAFSSHALSRKVDINSLYEHLNKLAILNFHEKDGRIIGTVFTPGSSAIKDLGSSADLNTMLEEQRGLLLQGKDDAETFAAKSPNHVVGNKINLMLFRPFEKELAGYARYIVIGSDELLSFSLSTLPEQQDGLRYMAEKRVITASPSFPELLRSAPELGSFSPDIMAFADPDSEVDETEEDDVLGRGKKNQPVAFEVISLHFRPDNRQILLGKTAETAKYTDMASGTRYIYLSGIEATADGGFKLADGDLTLSQVQSQSLKATTVFLGYNPDNSLQLKRVRAFMNAGARSVVVMSWELPEKVERFILDKVFETLNRDESISKALKEGRKEYSKSLNKSRNTTSKTVVNNPGIWGAFYLFGRP